MNDSAQERGFISWITRLVREHRAALAAIARQEGLREADALDAVQDAFATFLGVGHARKLSRDAEESRKLLVVLVRNAARNARRRHHRSRPHAEDDLASLAADQPSVDELLAEAEAHVMALGCIERLGEVQRHVVTLRLLEDQLGEQVAALLGTTPGHVAVLLHRAKAALRACMSDADA